MREGSPSLVDAIHAFLEDVGIRLAPLTRVTYERHLRPLRALEWPLTDAVCRSLIADMVRAGRAASTIDCFAGVLMAFVKFCREMGWIYTDPMAHVSTPKIEQKPHRFLSMDEIERIREAAVELDGVDGARVLTHAVDQEVDLRPQASVVGKAALVNEGHEIEVRPRSRRVRKPPARIADRPAATINGAPSPSAQVSVGAVPVAPELVPSVVNTVHRPPSYTMIVAFLLTGLRASELLSLRAEDIDGGLILVRGKGARYRYVPLPDVPLPASGLLFLFGYRSLLNYVHALGRRAGVAHLHPHLFRHSWASHGVQHLDMITVQTVGGWASDKMLRHYAASTIQRAAAEKARGLF